MQRRSTHIYLLDALQAHKILLSLLGSPLFCSRLGFCHGFLSFSYLQIYLRDIRQRLGRLVILCKTAEHQSARQQRSHHHDIRKTYVRRHLGFEDLVRSRHMFEPAFGRHALFPCAPHLP